MAASGAWARELMTRELRQPDQRSCGAAVLVVAQALREEPYARWLVTGTLAEGTPADGIPAEGAPADFDSEVLAMHRRTTGPVDASGRPQLPWSRALGTPPWAVARQLSARTGVRHHVAMVWPWLRRRRWAALVEAVRAGWPVPVYLGSGTLPRHVVLALEAGPGGDGPLRVYDPASGRSVRLPAEAFVGGGIPGRWHKPWFVIAPRLPTPPPPERRTRA